MQSNDIFMSFSHQYIQISYCNRAYLNDTTFFHMRQVYDRPKTLVVSCKSNLQLAYDCRVCQKICRRILKHVLKRCDNIVTEIDRNDVFCDKFLLSGGWRRSFLRQNGGQSCCWLIHMKSFHLVRKLFQSPGQLKYLFTVCKNFHSENPGTNFCIFSFVTEKSRARVNDPKSCCRPVVSLSHAHRANRP